MSRIAYVNGRYLPQASAAVQVEDRGYQFADGQKIVKLDRAVLADGKEIRLYGDSLYR